MTDALQRHKLFEQVFQIAFVSTVVALIITFAMMIVANLLPNQLFSSGGVSILPQYSDGTWNINLITGLVILGTYFVIYIIPTAIGLRNGPMWSRRVIYAYIPVTLVYLIITVFVLPLTNNRVPNLQGNFYPIVLTLAAAASYLICSHPLIANRAERRKKQRQKP